MRDISDPRDPIPTAEILVEARGADLARLAFGLRPAVDEFVAHAGLPLADERDLDHDEGLGRTKARRSLRVSVPRGCRRPRDSDADTLKADATMAQDGRVDQEVPGMMSCIVFGTAPGAA